MNKLHCWWFGHTWANDKHYPTHGYRDIPYSDSYCSRCNAVPGYATACTDEELDIL